MLVSVIVPVLDEAAALGGCLDQFAALEGPLEVVVCDGGSADATLAIARAHPLAPRVLEAPRGRASQMNAGAAAARGDVLLFLHADTRLPHEACASIRAALADPQAVGGNFALRFDDAGWFARAAERWYALQRRLGEFYGDSAIFVRRGAFERLGGYPPVPVMEDLAFVRRMRRLGRTPCLPGPARTSARRYRSLGTARALSTWLAIRVLYDLGVPPERLAERYPPVR